MKQKKLVSKLYKACIEGNTEKIADLQKKEFIKIFKHKEEGKPFSARWTVVKI